MNEKADPERKAELLNSAAQIPQTEMSPQQQTAQLLAALVETVAEAIEGQLGERKRIAKEISKLPGPVKT